MFDTHYRDFAWPVRLRFEDTVTRASAGKQREHHLRRIRHILRAGQTDLVDILDW